MYDKDIRKALGQHLVDSCRFIGSGISMIVDELDVCGGEARIDVVAIGDEIVGYEIKSERDSLSRLTSQLAFYGDALPRLNIVVGSCHLNNIIESLPHWCGLYVAHENGDRIDIVRVRESDENPNIKKLALAQFLWRDEALKELSQRGLDKGLRTKPRQALWEKLAQELTLSQLLSAVAHWMRNRTNWKNSTRTSYSHQFGRQHT